MVLCQFFQDLSSKVDILIDIWGPGHGVDNLTDNNQLALTSRGPHQMNIFIISSLGVCPSRAEVIGDLIITGGINFNFLALLCFPLPFKCRGMSGLNKGKYFCSAVVDSEGLSSCLCFSDCSGTLALLQTLFLSGSIWSGLSHTGSHID